MESNNYSNLPIKYINQRKIINLLCNIKTIKQVDIGKEIDISLPTIITNVNELVKEGILENGGVGHSRGGRKPIIVNINKDYKYILGIDFLVDKIKLVLFNFIMEPIVVEEVKSSRFIDFNTVMDKFVNIIKDILIINNIPISKLLGIGVSIPGIVNGEANNIEAVPKLHIAHAELKKYNNLFGVPIYFENEANAACYAEWQVGAAKGLKNIIYLSIMKGVGAGIIINNQQYRGEYFKAGEIGHIIIEKNGRLCSCGDKGCLNEYISIDAIYKEYKNKTGKTIDNMPEFMALRESNDTAAVEIWKEYVDNFAYGLKLSTMILDPKIIIIGGEIANYCNILLPEINKIFKHSKSNIFSKNNKITASKLKENASVIGVALYLRNKFIENYKPISND